MEYRKITEQEQEQAIFIISQAFYYDCSAEYKLLENDKFRYEDFYGAFDDSGKIAAALQNEPHFMWLDGQSVKSGGIANVSSLPENRRGGHIRKLIKLACDDMYEDGCVMSYLYPFSYPYYRKFGYELCNENMKMEASPEEILPFDFNGSAQQFEPGEDGTDPTDIIAIYEAFSQRYNTMLDRDAWQWERKLEHDPVKSKFRTYIIYDAQGEACAYFTYVYDRQRYEADIAIKDMAWKDTAAMYLMFAFWRRFIGNVTKITFSLPPDTPPSYIWSEPRNYKISFSGNGMARVINAQKALESIRKPAHAGSFTIKIDDSFMPQNNKSYKVSWENSKSTTEEVSCECDIECSSQALAQLVTGFADIEKAALRGDVKINSNIEVIKAVFIKKPVFIADYF